MMALRRARAAASFVTKYASKSQTSVTKYKLQNILNIYLLSIILVPVWVEVVLLNHVMSRLDIIVVHVISVIQALDSQHMDSKHQV